MSSNLSRTVERGTGVVSGMGAMDRGVAQFFEQGYLQTIAGTGEALTVLVAFITVCTIVFFISALGIVDFDNL